MTPPKAALIVFPSNIGLISLEIGFDVLVFGIMFSIINAGISRIKYKKCLNFSSEQYHTISNTQSQTYNPQFGISLIYLC